MRGRSCTSTCRTNLDRELRTRFAHGHAHVHAIPRSQRDERLHRDRRVAHQIEAQPLRERGEDVLLLAKHYMDNANQRRNGSQLKGLAPDVERLFLTYAWTGNVRELRNVIERASILEDSPYVTTAHLPADMLRDSAFSSPSAKGIILPPDGIPLEAVEAELARQAYERAGGNLTKAAKLLDISRDQLRYKLKKSGDYVVE